MKPGDTDVERMNRTYISEKDDLKRRIILMRDKLQKLYGYRYPIQRRVIEDRVAFLEKQFLRFEYLINPYHIQPGILLDVNITSIKRKKATLDGMANVLNEFLYGVSKGFQDAAFASFSRRRSTVRADIAQSFAATAPETPAPRARSRSISTCSTFPPLTPRRPRQPSRAWSTSPPAAGAVARPRRRGGDRGRAPRTSG